MGIDRPSRVAELVHAEIAQILRTEMKDPTVGAVSITRVVLSKDLKHARVYFLPLGGSGDSAEYQLGLERAGGWLRTRLGRRLRLRHTPRLRFLPDTGLDEAVRVNSILERLETERLRQGGEE